MLDFPRWKQVWLWALTLLAMLAAVPTLVTQFGGHWPSYLPDPEVSLGLDLAGGSYLLLEAEPGSVAKQRVEGMAETVRSKLNEAKIRIGDVSTADGKVTFMLEDPSKVDAARQALLSSINGTGRVSEWHLDVLNGNTFVLTLTQKGLAEDIDTAMDSARDVVNKRVDAIGTKESTVVREGADRIMVQVPGLQNPQQLRDLLGKTAELEFKLVDSNALQSDIAQGIAPPGDEIVPYAPGTPYAGTSIAVKRLGGIRGSELTKAQPGNKQQTNEPIVNIEFNSVGAEKFARLTTENVGKQFAIILDGQVISAPSIESPILGGSGYIEGSFTTDSANQLAIELNSGALPLKLNVIDQSTVSAELGADSIHKGAIAMLVGTILVVLLIAAAYGRFGIYADLAVLINAVMILGIMAIFTGTLTLPGIAGFVLTIGTAVDANVLINERIREELRKGRKSFQAVDLGYTEASRTIFDANITHGIAATLMFMFGSGPIKGFAVVLMIGIATSVFTAVYLTRMWVALWLRRARPAELQI